MPTLTSKATYQKGIVIPEIHPPLSPTETVVIFIHKDRSFANALLVLKALKEAKGILPKNIDGIKYEDRVRKIAALNRSLCFSNF